MYLIPDNADIFPHPLLVDEEGVLAFGGTITPQSLLTSYSLGIFPWYNDHPVLWWNTHPRCVLFPDQLKVHKSMRPYFNQNKFQVSYNQCFLDVITHCKEIERKDQMGSWLNDQLIHSFSILHEKGYVQTVEVWQEGQLVGGLYGLLLGNIFFGESMFALVPNASKFGFISLVRKLESQGVRLIDCQQETAHLVSMGATTISKFEFWSHIKRNLLDILRSK